MSPAPDPVRPGILVAVVGTGTEVGKTWVSCRLLEAWREDGLAVAARKPAQSYAPGEGPTDAELLAGASGEGAVAVCSAARSYEVPLAPPMAARRLGRAPVRLADLVAELSWPPGRDVGLVETAGGLRSPLAEDGDSIDLVGSLRPGAIVLVAPAGLGAINDVLLSTEALGRYPWEGSPPLIAVVLNRFDEAGALAEENRAWLASRALTVSAGRPGELRDLAGRLLG